MFEKEEKKIGFDSNKYIGLIWQFLRTKCKKNNI